MKEICVHASTPYRILIGDRLLDRAGELCREAIGACRLCVVTDDTVNALYAERLESALTAAGYEKPLCFVFPHGEGSKNLQTLGSLLEFIAEGRLTRTDCLIALGGGVVGDMTGFASAVYLRGIRFVQIPTTLLAAVDSSVGGKTGVDLCAGKNLAGAFHQPSLVICDPTTLDTLPDATYADGCAEVIKYGMINDKPLFERLRFGVKSAQEDIIAACVEDKRALVEQDEFDRGQRQLLNLGHTVGHAIEQCSHFRISHGSAVAAGMAIVTRAAVRRGLCPADASEALEKLLRSHHLPTGCGFTASELAAVASADKKRTGDRITLVVPYGVGDSRLYPIAVGELADFIREGLLAL